MGIRRQEQVIMCHDPSLTAWGWALVNPKKNHMLVDKGVIKTEPEAKKRKIRMGDDRVRRVNEIVTALDEIFKQNWIIHMVSELPHGSQSSSAAIMQGIVIGLLQTFCRSRGIGVEWFMEGDAKKAMGLSKGASKRDMIKAVCDKFGTHHIQGVKYKDEAVSDALAIYYTALKESPTVMMLRSNDDI